VKPLSDRALERLREAAAMPDFSETRYSVIRELGRGGMGVVYLAEDEELDRQVAVKVLHLDDRSVELASRMKTEAKTLAHLEHPNIVPVYDAGVLPDGRLFYVMKWVQGLRLDEYARQQHSLPDRLRLLEKIGEAVSFAHSRGVVHRDLKPDNIMVGAFGEVLIMDWGLARILDRCEPSGRVMGTPDWMSPEQSRGDPVDQRTDIWSVGRLLSFLAGDQAPKPLRSIASKAMAPLPADRYTDVEALVADVLRYLDGEPVAAHEETAIESLQRYYSRNRTLLLLITAYIAMRFLVFFMSRR
jgi:serine/threonine protein kinase